MVDLSRATQDRVRTRLLDLVPGRPKKAYADWLAERSESFRAGVRVAALDPFAGYKGAIEDQLEDAVAMLDAFPRRQARHAGCGRGPWADPETDPGPARP